MYSCLSACLCGFVHTGTVSRRPVEGVRQPGSGVSGHGVQPDVGAEKPNYGLLWKPSYGPLWKPSYGPLWKPTYGPLEQPLICLTVEPRFQTPPLIT